MSDDCGCCATPPTGTAIENRPGLTALAYRPGTFATFRQELIEELARANGLASLTARGSDDYTIATIELWSAVADVLAFYQERLANESFLRTAVQRDSLLRLVRLIGYELAPGVSAQTWLAFTVERDATATVPARTRVKSVPVAKELPSTFETMEPLDADATWNALQPFRLRRHVLRAGDQAADFEGVSTGLSPGDVLVFTGKKKRHDPKSTQWDVARVRTVEPDPKRRRTRVTWWPPLGNHPGRTFPKRAHVHVLRQRGGVFGHNAPDWHMISDAGKQQLLGLPAPGDVTDDDRQEWPQFEIYAPFDPNQPRRRASTGVLTIPPTAQSVADAAIAAAKASKEAVIADVVASAAEAAASLANAVAKANDVSRVLMELVIPAAAAQANAAATAIANANSAITQYQARLNGLPGALTGFAVQYALDLAVPVVGPVLAPANLAANIAAEVGAIQAAAANLIANTFGAAVDALTELLKTFQTLSDNGGFTGAGTTTPSLKTAIDRAAQAAHDAMQAATTAAGKVFRPLGALATEAAVEAAVRWAIDNHDVLDRFIPSAPFGITDAQRVGIVAIVTAKFVQTSFGPGGFTTLAGVPNNGDIERVLRLAIGSAGAAIGASAAASAIGLGAFLAAGSGGVPGLVLALIAAVALWPVIFAGMVAAIVVRELARPGAERVADDVIVAVLAALQVAHPAAPPRYLPLPLTKNRVDLDMVYPRIVGGSWVLLSSPLRMELYRAAEVQQTSRTDYSLTGAVTRLKLKGNGLEPDSYGHNPYFHIRETAVFGASEELKLALDTVSDPFTGTTIDVLGTPAAVVAGRTLLIAGTDAASGQPASDLVTLVSQAPAPRAGTGVDHTILTLASNVTRQYALDGLVVYGNVTYATNGETVRNEVVGDGDASQGFQKFPLRKKPVTYAPDRHTGLVHSSLTLLVNSVKWDEVATLYGAAPADPVYTARIADDTTLTVTFGDGVSGARLPTGRQNVVAQYRQGIGTGGNVGAQRITTLIDRPKGLRAATNPAAAEGGVDPESLAGARTAAPGSVRTFGRAVSLRDFEDSTLFNGMVAKASATWVWTGERRAIHLTVAAAGGAILSDETIRRLRARLDDLRDPNQRLLIDNYVGVPIVIDAALTVDDRHVAAEVLAAARATLLATFAFDARGFGQPVFLSDTFTLLQQVPGVLSVDVNRLDLKGGDAEFRAAHGVDDSLAQPQPRLLMLPARPDQNTGKVRPAELAVVEADTDVTLSSTGGILL